MARAPPMRPRHRPAEPRLAGGGGHRRSRATSAPDTDRCSSSRPALAPRLRRGGGRGRPRHPPGRQVTPTMSSRPSTSCATPPRARAEPAVRPRRRRAGRWSTSAAGACTWCAAGPPAAGPLTVLLEAGSFGFSADWAVVQEQAGRRAGLRSIAYDRAGLGHSDPGPQPRDGLAIAADLEALLAPPARRVPSSYVGHSMAGLHAHLFAGRNRGRLAGLVLVDAITPAAVRRPGRAARWSATTCRLARAAAWAARRRAASRPLGAPGRHHRPAAARPRPTQALGLRPRRPQPRRRRRGAGLGDDGRARPAAAGPLDPAWPVAVVTAGPPRGWPRQRQPDGRAGARPRATATSPMSPPPTTPACSACATPTPSSARSSTFEAAATS